MKDIKIVPVIEKGMEIELSTYFVNGSLVFERTEHEGKIVYCSIHKLNIPDAGRFLKFGVNSKWRVKIDSFVERDSCIKCYVALVGETPIESEKKEFRIPGTDIVRGGEIEVLVLKTRDGEGNFILPDTRNSGIKIYFQVPYWDEEQNHKLNDSNSVGKMKAVVDFINITPLIEGRPRVYNVRVILQGQPISRPVFGDLWTGRSYKVAVDRTVRVNPTLMSVRIGEKRVYFALDTHRSEIKESKSYLIDHHYLTVDLYITRGEVRGNEVFLYGIISCFAKKLQKNAA